MKKGSGLTLVALVVLVFYIMFNMRDPVQIYDEVLKAVQDYSTIASGVTKLWRSFTTWPERLGMTSTGLVNWFVELLTKGEHTAGSWLFEKILSVLR